MGLIISIVLLIVFVINGFKTDPEIAEGLLIAAGLFAISGSIDLFSTRYMNLKKGE